MSEARETISRFLEVVSHLGRPDRTTEELAWVTDIPAGNKLLDWIATQAAGEDLSSNISPTTVNDKNNEAALRARLSSISLYPEEVHALSSLSSDLRSKEATTSAPSRPIAYEVPAQLRMREKYTEREGHLLEKQAARLQHRLKATKHAQRELKQTINVLRRQIQVADETIETKQQNLAERSAKSDTDILRHRDAALQLIKSIIPAPLDSEPLGYLDQQKSEIAALTSSRAGLASAVKKHYQALDEAYASLPAVSDLEREADSVHAALQLHAKGKDKSKIGRLIDAAYIEELDRVSTLLEAGGSGLEQIDEYLRSSASGNSGGPAKFKVDVDIQTELELAGRMDRMTLLQAQEKALDAAIAYHKQTLLPRLQATYDELHARSAIAAETEALVSALVEELEDANDVVDMARRPRSPNTTPGDLESMLEAEVKELLKSLQGEEGRQTVLLDHADVTAELVAIQERLRESETAEEKWAASLKSQLDDLSRGTAPLLATAYANSPFNTSPAFAPDASSVKLEEEARVKAECLTSAAARLQKETRLSTRDKRKLGEFVQKWH